MPLARNGASASVVSSNANQSNNAWTNGPPKAVGHSKGGNHLLRSVVTKQAYSRVPNGNAPGQQATPAASQVASQFNQMTVGANGGNNMYYNPSAAPSASMMSGPFARGRSNTTSQCSGQSHHGKIQTKYCRLSGKTRRHYRKGDIVALPFHNSNVNPNATTQDPRLLITCEGPVYSKRRMMVVMWKYEQTLFCLPLYSFGFRGLSSKPEFLKKEYVCLVDVNEQGFVNQGPNPYLQSTSRKPLDPKTTVHITGGREVECEADTNLVGSLTPASYGRLFKLWQDLSIAAQAEH